MADKSVREILTQALDLLRDPKRWTQGAYARDANGGKVGALNPNAVCWCENGALIKCGGGDRFGGGLTAQLIDLFRSESAGPVHTNDDKGHAAVMQQLSRLIEKAAA